MSKKTLLSGLMLKCLIFLSSAFYSCGNATTEQTSNQNHEVEIVEAGETYSSSGKVIKSLHASYVAPGAIIKNTTVPIKSVFEYDRQGRKTIERVESGPPGAGNFKFTNWLDSLGRAKKFESYVNNKLSVFQENVYNANGELDQELRIEYNEGKADTTLYEYHYGKKQGSKPIIAFRTNNKDTVTRITILKEDNIEFRTEEAYPNRGFTSISTTTTIKNKIGAPVEIRTQLISENWSDKTKLDTSLTIAKMIYNEQRQLLEELKTYGDGLAREKYTYTYKHGAMLTKKVQKGLQSYTIRFKQTFW